MTMLNDENNSTLSTGRLLLILALFSIGNLYNVFQRFALAVISSDLALEFSMTPSMLGTLSSCYLYSYAVMQVVSGLLATRFESRTMIGLALLAAAVTGWFFTRAQTVLGLMVFRALIGVFCAFVYIPALNTLRVLSPPKWTTLLMGIFIAVGQVGNLLASSPLKFVCNLFGWRTVFFWFAVVLPLAAGILIWLLLPRIPKPGGSAARPAGEILRGVGRNFKSMLIPGVFVIIMWSILAGSPRYAFASVWGAQFYENAAGYNPGIMSIILTCYAIGCVLGGPVCAWISNRFGVMKTLAASTLATGIIWILLVPAELAFASPFVQMAAMLLLGIAGIGAYTCAFASVKYFNFTEAAGVFSGIVNSTNFLSGAIISQVTGRVVEKFINIKPIELYGAVFTCFSLTSFVIFFLIIITNRKYLKY